MERRHANTLRQRCVTRSFPSAIVPELCYPSSPAARSFPAHRLTAPAARTSALRKGRTRNRNVNNRSRRQCTVPMMIQNRIGAVTVLIALSGAVQAQVAQVRSYTEAHRAELTGKFRDFLSIPNVAADPAGLEHNANFLVSALRERGVEARRLTLAGAPAVVYGEIRTPGAKHTIVLYAHYDGQPVSPSEWDTPPFSGSPGSRAGSFHAC